MKNIVIFLWCAFSFSQATKYVPSNIVTAASRGIVYDDLSFDNAPILKQILIDSDNEVFDGVSFENRVVNFDTMIRFDFGEQAITNGLILFCDDNTQMVTFYCDDAIGRMFSTALGHEFRNVTYEGIKFEYVANAGFFGENTDSILSFDHYTSNIYVDRCEFTAPNAEIDGFSGYSQFPDGLTDFTIANSYFHDIGRFACETFGERPSDFSNYDPVTDAFLKRILWENNVTERTGTIDHLGLSIVQTVYDVKIRNSTFEDCRTALEIGATNVEITNVTVTGNDNGFWIGGVYDNFNTVIYGQNDYRITNLTMDITGRPHIIMGINNVVFDNCNMRWTGGSWWNSFATNIDVINSTLDFNSSQGVAIEMSNDIGTWNWSNNILTNNSNDPIFESPSDINLSCNEIYLPSGQSFTGSDANTITDTSIFVNGVFNNEIGDTATDCGIIGYTQGIPPVDPPVDPPTLPSLNAIKRSLYYNIFNN